LHHNLNTFIPLLFSTTHQSKSLNRYTLQLEVITQLSTKIETQISTLEKHLSTVPRSTATTQRATHVKLVRDYRLVEQQYKNVCLDVRRRRGVAEGKRREMVMEEERRRNGEQVERDGEVEVRRQMQIQQDVSFWR
jgi:hypothetical protein